MDSGRGASRSGRRDRVLERMSDRYLELDADCRVVDCNAAGRDLLTNGTDPAGDVLGRDVRDLLSGPDVAAVHEGIGRAAGRGTAVTVEATLANPDGWFEFRAYPEEDGVAVYVTPSTPDPAGPDVLERRAAVMSDLHDAFEDPSASLDAKVTSLLAVGRAALDTEYATLSRVRDDRYVFEYVDAVDDAVEAGDVVDLPWTTCELVVANEERLVLSDLDAEAPAVADREGNRQLGLSCYIGAPVVVEDDTYGTLCFYDRDARDPQFSEWEAGLVDFMALLVGYELRRHRAEARLRERNEALEQFRQVLSHDLRNPMTVAQGYVDLARESGDPELLDRVADSIDRMESIIDDVSDIAAVRQDGLEAEPIDLATVATAAWEMVAVHDGALEVTADRAVRADGSRLQRLLENLLANAVTHTDGPVTVEVGDRTDGFYVADTGDGVDPDIRERVFETGFSTGDGTGLGLSIVTEIADVHGWSYDLTESDSGGARFEFTGVERP